MILKPSLDLESSLFKENKESYLKLLEEFREKEKEAGSQTTSSKKDKLSVKKRIDLLKDEGTSFLEFSSLSQYGVYGKGALSSLITGVAQVKGKECVIVANNPFIKGGTYYPLTVKKHLRAQEVALENKLPCLYLVDSGGAFLPLQAEVFPDRDHFGRIFYNQSLLSSMEIPQVSVVLGSSTAGGAYVPAMSDENIIVKNKGYIFLGGPPLVEAATGEKVSSEELGGGDLHCQVSGVSDHLVEDEEEAFKKLRGIVSTFQNKKYPFKKQSLKEPLYPRDKIYGVIPQDLKKPFDMRDVLSFLLDGSELEEFKKNYGTSLITGFAHICGSLVGIVASNGILFSESALKGTHFIDLCDVRGIPLIFFQNIQGFMVGKEYEKKGIAKNGAKMVQAVSLARVPKFTVIVGGSFGAGNYALCGRSFSPRLLFSWPSSKISVMGGQEAAEVIWTLKKDQGLSEDEVKRPILEKYEKESSSFYATARLWDDGIIDPKDTRRVLSMSLSLSENAPLKERRKGIYRM